MYKENMIQEFDTIAIINGEHEVSYSELLQRIAIYTKYSPKGKGEKTVIFSENREGWVYSFFSVWANLGIAVPVDATATVADLEYILRDCTPSCIWTSRANEEVARKAITAAELDIKVNIIDDYENVPVSSNDPKSIINYETSDTALIIYTSGTTGNPKGVMLSFSNVWANMKGVCEEVKIFNPQRRTLMLLPIHHVLPLVGTMVIPIVMGGGLAICPTMSGPDIMATLCRGKIAIFVGVPRLWQTLYTGIKKKIDSKWITRALFNLCARVGSRTLSRIVFSSVRKKMGGHIEFCVSGGAALDKEIGEGLRTLGLDVLEGYGMTETSPIISFTRPGDIIPGCTGLPLPSVECKIVDGELCAKGPNVMQGYYNRPAETAAVIDKDGFVHTGDLARFDEKGRIYITGRTKDIIVLSNGKNVQPNEIEYKIEKFDQYVKEAAVTQKGDMLCAIVVPQKAVEDKDDAELEKIIKRDVIEPYNLSVSNYKKVMSIVIYRGDLPRTKLDKLQRYKLKDIVEGSVSNKKNDAPKEEPKLPEYLILKKYIEEEKKIKVVSTDHIETDLALDSLDKIGLQSFIEQTFGMSMTAEKMLTFSSIFNMAEYIAAEKTRVDVGDVDWHQLLNQPSSTKLPSTSWYFSVGTRVFSLLLKVYNRLSIKGRKNIPSGPVIITPNHQSFLDGPAVMSGVPFGKISDCYFYATELHVRSGFRKYMARHNNVVVMERNNLKESIVALAEVLRSGKNVVLFPEGERSYDGQLGAFKKTFAILSKELQVPVVPVRISGAYKAWPRSKHLPRPAKIGIEFLTPIEPGAKSYDEIVNEVRKSIEG